MIDGDSSDQVEILRAELAELRLRLEMYREAFGEGIGQCGEDLVAHVEVLVRKLVNEFFTASTIALRR